MVVLTFVELDKSKIAHTLAVKRCQGGGGDTLPVSLSLARNTNNPRQGQKRNH